MRMKTRPWSYGISLEAGRAGRGDDWARGLGAVSVPGIQIPSSSGAAEGLRSPLGLVVEDERLPWFLKAPSGED